MRKRCKVLNMKNKNIRVYRFFREIGRKLYIRLKKIYEPRKGPQLIMTYDKTLNYVQANTASLPCAVVGEKSNDPTTWVWMPEFSVPVGSMISKDRFWVHFVESFFESAAIEWELI